MAVFLLNMFPYVHLQGSQDPCDDGNHQVIDDPTGDRSIHTTLSDTALCDRRITEGWYRTNSPSGGDMPTVCPSEGQCSTVNPVWIG